MKDYAIYFTPLGSLASWPLSSDTLFGAVCWGIRTLGLMDDKQLLVWLKGNRHSPPFAFSHAFPLQLENKLRFFPRPNSLQTSTTDIETLSVEYKTKNNTNLKTSKAKIIEIGKKIKNIKYVSESVLNQIIHNNLGAIDIYRSILFDQGEVTNNSYAILTKKEAADVPDRLLITEAVQHNQIDRQAGSAAEGMLYYRAETFFAPGAGLWALLRCEDEIYQEYLLPSLRYLEYTGFGLDRTSGKGHFHIDVNPLSSLPASKSPRAMMTLSRFLPQKGELSLKGAPLAYTLITLRPKREQKFPRSLPPDVSSTPIYKRSLRVFETGSVFPFTISKEIYGQLVRVTPSNHEPVYQSGAAIMVFL